VGWLRRLLVCLLALVVCGESMGVARAFGRASTVDCCCGAHAVARPCPCKSCPVARHAERRHAPDGDRLAPARACGGDASDPGVLSLLAPAAAPGPTLGAPRLVGRLTPPGVPPVRGRLLDAGRPPP
jgi:hypothetical protein